MNKKELVSQIQKKNSMVCVGLDTDLQKIPSFLLKEKDPIFEFNKRIIDATADHVVAYKPNIAFYEALGPRGWESLQRTIEYIPEDIFTIADAKRGDIGNTSKLYAKAFFENMDFDSVTVAPYMGEDSVKPFLEFTDKWVILLVHTSNTGSKDFQLMEDTNHQKLFEKVIEKSQEWATPEQLMFVVGATRGEKIGEIRKLAPHNFFLVPGIGAQGGDLEEVIKHGLNEEGGMLINSARGIIYASSDTNFAAAAGKECKKLKEEISKFVEIYQ